MEKRKAENGGTENGERGMLWRNISGCASGNASENASGNASENTSKYASGKGSGNAHRVLKQFLLL